MVGFYTVMGSISLARMFIIRQISPLPLKTVPYVLVPFLITYQADLAYGTKSERISTMAKHIREQETYWFNEPIELPPHMKPYYEKMTEMTNAQLRNLGHPPEKPWAK
jgi:hypothetical protein